MSVERRDVVKTIGAGVAAAPFLAGAAANAESTVFPRVQTQSSFGVINDNMGKGAMPVITVFDHRGCSRTPKEYVGDKSGDQDDEMCVKVQMKTPYTYPQYTRQATALLNEIIGVTYTKGNPSGRHGTPDLVN